MFCLLYYFNTANSGKSESKECWRNEGHAASAITMSESVMTELPVCGMLSFSVNKYKYIVFGSFLEKTSLLPSACLPFGRAGEGFSTCPRRTSVASSSFLLRSKVLLNEEDTEQERRRYGASASGKRVEEEKVGTERLGRKSGQSENGKILLCKKI